MDSMKPLTVIKKFFHPTANVDQMKHLIADFSRPLNDDPDFVWCVNEAAREMGVAVDWPSS